MLLLKGFLINGGERPHEYYVDIVRKLPTHKLYELFKEQKDSPPILFLAIREGKIELVDTLVEIARRMLDREDQRHVLYHRLFGNEKLTDFAIGSGNEHIKDLFIEWEDKFVEGDRRRL
jgi:hypothetical protein